MAQPVQQVAIRAPGFEGLNTEISPINGDPEFALVADNVVVDQIGRLASRKAFCEHLKLDGNFDAVDLNMPSHNWEGWSAKPYAYLLFYPRSHPDYPEEQVDYEPIPGYENSVYLDEWANQGTIDGVTDFFGGSVTPELTAPKLADWPVSSLNPNGFAKPVWIFRISAIWNTDPTDKPGVTLIATQNGNEIGRFYLLKRDRYEITFETNNPNAPIKISFVPDPGLVEQYGDSLGLGRCHFVSPKLYVRDSKEDAKAFNEIIRMGKDIQGASSTYSNNIQAPVFIYRYGTEYVYPTDTRSVPVGMSRKRVGKAQVPEIGGSIDYGVAVAGTSEIQELVLPTAYQNYLLTAELVNFSAEDLTTGNDRLLLFVSGKPFLRLDNDNEWVDPGAFWTDGAGDTHPIDGNIAISAYGRVWVTGVGGDYHQIYYSALLDETVWYDESADFDSFNDAGIIDVREYWPVDGDSIVNIHAHNGYLLVFGRNSILVYANADSGSPAGIINQPDSGIFLQDAISNVGLVRRDAICNIGTDVLFVDDSGVRSLGRVIQEKSNPLQEPSLNIRREIQEVIALELKAPYRNSAIKFRYLPSESLAVLLFASLNIAYAFHLNSVSKTGGLKVTRWTDCYWNDCIELKSDQEDIVYMGGKPTKGLMKYEGYLEKDAYGVTQPYVMRYESMALALGQSPMQTVIPKSIHYVCMAEYVPGQGNALWGFSDRFVGSREFQIEVDGGSEYSVNEFGSFTQDADGNVVSGPTEVAGYYPDGGPYYKGYKINTTGSGELFRVGFEVKVQGGRYALQEIDINSAVGRLTA